jgi:phosphohistidine phosphatase
MEVYFLRHGIAEARRAGRTDAERRLTEEGRQKLRQVLARGRAAKAEPTLILTSPLVRAVETAEIAAEVLRYKGAIVPADALLPSSSPREVWRELGAHAGEAAILLAGHEPLLSETASYLVGASRVVVEMKKGALLRIDVEIPKAEPQGVIQWLLTAKLADRPDLRDAAGS